MSSHVDKRVNDLFLDWCNKKYGTYGEVKATRGTVHDYLGMTIEFDEKGRGFKIHMIDYLEKMLEEFPVDLSSMKNVPSAAPADLFSLGDKSPLDTRRRQSNTIRLQPSFYSLANGPILICRL